MFSHKLVFLDLILIFVLTVCIYPAIVVAEENREVRGGFFDQHRATRGLFDDKRPASSWAENKPAVVPTRAADSFAIPENFGATSSENAEKRDISSQATSVPTPTVKPTPEPTPEPKPSADNGERSSDANFSNGIHDVIKDSGVRKDLGGVLGVSNELKRRLKGVKINVRNSDGSFSPEKLEQSLEENDGSLLGEEPKPKKKEASHTF